MLKICSIGLKLGQALMIFLLAFASSASFASDEQRYYDIEIVLFLNSSALRTLPELNPDPAAALELPENYIQLGMPNSTENSKFIPEYYFQPLPETAFQLREAAEKLTESNQYRIIKHFAWRQPGLDRKVALPIYIQETFYPEVADAASTTESVTAPAFAQARLDGLIKVTLARYLHLETELRLEASGIAPPPEQSNPALEAEETPVNKPRPTTVLYAEKQKRRMRSKELHYIDHPVFGLLVIMTPVEVPKPEETSTIQPLSPR